MKKIGRWLKNNLVLQAAINIVGDLFSLLWSSMYSYKGVGMSQKDIDYELDKKDRTLRKSGKAASKAKPAKKYRHHRRRLHLAERRSYLKAIFNSRRR